MTGGVPDPVADLLDDDAEDLYENAPCGYLSTLLDGRIVKVNATLLGWLGHAREDVVGRRFPELLSVGGRIHHETHVAPLLQMRGAVSEIAVELLRADGTRLTALVTSATKADATGRPQLIRTTVFDARERRAYEQELLRARRDAESAQAAADRERARAQSLTAILQRSLLPPTLAEVPGLEAAAHYHPASDTEVGGDFYDLFPLGQGRWGFFLGDVCGKGATAAAVTSLTRYTLRSAAVHDPEPAAVLRTLNSVLRQGHDPQQPALCTVLFGLLTPGPERVEVTLASGGHPPPLLLGADGAAAYLPGPGGQMLGVFADPSIGAVTPALRPGDTLLLYTDGLSEARTGAGPERYDEEALLAFAAARSPSRPAALVGEVVELLAGFGSGVEDDVALLAIGVPRA